MLVVIFFLRGGAGQRSYYLLALKQFEDTRYEEELDR